MPSGGNPITLTRGSPGFEPPKSVRQQPIEILIVDVNEKYFHKQWLFLIRLMQVHYRYS